MLFLCAIINNNNNKKKIYCSTSRGVARVLLLHEDRVSSLAFREMLCTASYFVVPTSVWITVCYRQHATHSLTHV